MGYARKAEDKRRLKNLYEKTRNQCNAGALFNERKNRYIRYYAYSGSGYTKWLRRRSNKKLRKNMNLYRGGQYKKLYDYWWELY